MRKMSPLIVLLLHLSAVYCDSHTLRYYHTAVSVPGFGLPEYSSVGYVDDREIVNYDSESRRYRPTVQWMEKMDPGYWQTETRNAKESEAAERLNMGTLMYRFNQTGGLHILQQMYGCELRDDGSITGYDQVGYDGREFLFLDTQTAMYIPTMPQAQITTQRLNNPEAQEGVRQKIYLEVICINWLRRYVEYGREDLERKVQPEVKISGQDRDGIVTLHCQVYGFHPRPVDVKWMKNRVDEVPTYKTTHILPNPDGTYQIRVSVEVIPKEDERYSCYVDHSSLGEPLSIVWEPKKPRSWIILQPILLILAVIILTIVGFFTYKIKKSDYKMAKSSMEISHGWKKSPWRCGPDGEEKEKKQPQEDVTCDHSSSSDSSPYT